MKDNREKALDLLKTYLIFDDEEIQALREHITSISVSNKSASLDFTILANGCLFLLSERQGNMYYA